MPFDATAHALLSTEAAALGAGQIAAQARLAEDLLGVVPEDYDEWASMGNPEWAWTKVLPYFRRLESNCLNFMIFLNQTGCCRP